MKKSIVLALVSVMLIALFAGCEGIGAQEISVVSREDGSGTRGAFIELLGIEEKDASGNKVDRTTDEATIVNSTSVVITTVAGDKNSIGYMSLGSLNNAVKAVEVDGAAATVENIKDNSYKVSRPFNIATQSETNELTDDFINFILSAEGQSVVEEAGYISSVSGEAFSGTMPEGKIVVAGSSSVTPVMEKLKEAYLQINIGAEIEVQQSDSTTGMLSAIEGTCDIGMASRALKDSELEVLEETAIAIDGVAVIVNTENTVEGLTSAQIKDIFTGETTDWKDIEK